MLWAPFSATLHYHNRIVASTRKQRTIKNSKIDLLCLGRGTLATFPNFPQTSKKDSNILAKLTYFTEYKYMQCLLEIHSEKKIFQYLMKSTYTLSL